jgi:hypothetical protein
MDCPTGSMQRPALKRLMRDIEMGKIDVVDGQKIIRQRRVSLTFRCVVMGA